MRIITCISYRVSYSNNQVSHEEIWSVRGCLYTTDNVMGRAGAGGKAVGVGRASTMRYW